MKEPKKTVSFRLAKTTISELNQLTKQYNVSQASLIALIIHMAYIGDDLDRDRLDDLVDIARIS